MPTDPAHADPSTAAETAPASHQIERPADQGGSSTAAAPAGNPPPDSPASPAAGDHATASGVDNLLAGLNSTADIQRLTSLLPTTADATPPPDPEGEAGGALSFEERAALNPEGPQPDRVRLRSLEEGRWHGRITEQVYRVLKQTADYLRRVAGFEGTDPRFQQHIAEIEARIETARNTPEEGESNEAAAWPKEAPQFARRATIKETVQAVRDGVASRESKDKISAGFDAADTYGNMIGHQAGNTIRQEIPDATDRAAMPFVVEANGDRKALQADLAKIQASSDPKLAARFAPVVKHALANFTRLDALKGKYQAIADKQTTIERRSGITNERLQDHLLHRLELPENERHLEPLLLGKGRKYLARGTAFDRLSDAIQAGYKPQSTDLADLLERRVATGQRLVQTRKLYANLKAVPVPGDRERARSSTCPTTAPGLKLSRSWRLTRKARRLHGLRSCTLTSRTWMPRSARC